MSQSEVATKSAVHAVSLSGPIPIEHVQGGMDSLRKRVESGAAFLRAVAYPWGVEFEVCEVVPAR
jgi:hypothetical protein